MTAIPSYRGDSKVVALFVDAGFVVVDLGGLHGGQIQQVRVPLAAHNLIRLS